MELIREYETVFILDPEMEEAGSLSTLIERIEGVITKGGGDLLNADHWGKRKLAYEINKNSRGYYLLESYLGDTQFLQAKDSRVQEHARKATAGSLDPGTIAVRMEQYVYTSLKKKNFSTALASAAEVAKNLEGDCTEHACLLAAMLRVQKIPSRVTIGLVYAERLGAFGGHMWTEAWLDGKWVPLDATLGKGGIGPGHIKLADSSLSDDGPAPVTSFVPLMNMLSNVTIDIVSTEK